MKQLMATVVLITMLVLTNTSAFAGWLIFHKPAFKGKVIDAETKEPIEGAVVVVVYNKHTLISGPGGGHTSIVHIKEALTDKKGEFFFASYTTIIQPNSIEDYAEFIIYKPGYGSFPRNRITPPGGISLPTKERFFLAETFGKQGEIKIEVGKQRNGKRKVTFGVVELPPLRARDERLRATPGSPGFTTSKELPLLYKAINEERRRFGLGEIK